MKQVEIGGLWKHRITGQEVQILEIRPSHRYACYIIFGDEKSEQILPPRYFWGRYKKVEIDAS